MQIGCHVSISGSIDKAVDNALKRECSAFQIFTRSPRIWNAKSLLNGEVQNFKDKLSSSMIDPYATAVHMPYLPNLSTPHNAIYKRSVKILMEEIERAGKLGIPYIVTHLGSHLGRGEKEGIKRLVHSLQKGAQINNDVTILLENTAGQRNSVGSDFEQLASIYFSLKPSKRFGICLDTCHVFAAGYDLRTERNVKETFDKFNEAIGFEHLKILHLNDSKGEIGCRLDRHFHIGLGKIGEKGLGAVINLMNKKKVPMILETPIDNIRDDFENLKTAKVLAK